MLKRSLMGGVSIVVVSLMVSGCASIMTGTTQQLTFNSNPDGATVTVGGRVIGKTPVTTSLKKSSGQPLSFSKEGYKPLSMSLESRINGWFWGNIVIGGLVGSTTDGLSGAVNEYSPSQYMVTLQPANASQLESHTSLSNRQQIKEFVVSSYREIIDDTRKGHGQYLSSLLQLLHVKSDQEDQSIKKIKGLSEVFADIPEFADHVADLNKEATEKTDVGTTNSEANSQANSHSGSAANGKSDMSGQREAGYQEKSGLGLLFSFDYYFGGSPYGDIKKTFEDNVDFFNRYYGYPYRTTGSFDVKSTGLGGTIGLLWNRGPLELGPTISFIKGPEAKVKLEHSYLGYPIFSADSTLSTNFYRGTLMVRRNFLISDGVRFSLAGDIGFAEAKLSESGSDGMSDSWSGVTFMLSPGLRFGQEHGTTFDIGYRYLRLPAKSETDNFAAFEWNPSGLYAAITVPL